MQRRPRENMTEAPEPPPSQPPRTLYYDFGPFTLRTRDSVLLRDGSLVPMRHKVLETLRVLVEEHGHFISRAELLDRVWNGEFVEESSITQNISLLRRVLDPEFPGQRPIETLSKKGYRFAVPVTIREGDAPTPIFRANVAPAPSADAPPDHKSMVGQILVFAPSRIADAIIARDTAAYSVAAIPEVCPDEAVILAEESDTDVHDVSRDDALVATGSAHEKFRVPARRATWDSFHEEDLPRRRWIPWTAAIAVALLIVCGWVIRRHMQAASAKRHTVAILGMQNLKNDPQQDWVGIAIGEMLSTGLAVDSPISVISGAPVARMRHDTNLPGSLGLGPKAVGDACKYLSCTEVLAGSYLIQNGRIWLDVKLQDAATGKTTATIAVSGSENDLHHLIAESTAKLRTALGVAASPSK